MHAGAPDHPWRLAALAALPAAALLAWQTAFVWPFFSDDAFISLRYAARLLAGDGLSWTDGERVEGYSNLLWVLLCAALGGLGVDLVIAARALGGLATAVALVVLARAAAPRDLPTTLLAAIPPLLAASTQVALGWTLSGLEGPLVLCWLALGFTGLLRRFAAEGDVAAWPRAWLLRASVPFAVLCWTRPDGPLWVAATGAGLLLAAAPRGLARAGGVLLAFAALPLLAFLAQLAFRLAYHGDLVPNTAHVKAGFDPDAWPAGFAWIAQALRGHAGLVVPAAAAWLWLLLRTRTRPLAWLLGLPLLAWLLYLAAIGGDHFPCRRLLHGAIAPLALLAGVALATTGPRVRPWLALLLLAGAGWNVHLARSDAQGHELRDEVWEWRGRAVGQALRAAFGDQQPLLAVDAAGAVPFYSGLPALDLLGLCDRTIATTPLAGWLATTAPGTPKPPGHLRGNGRYVMDRAPDLLLFGPPPHLPLPVFPSALEFEDDPRFQQGYRCVLVELPAQPIARGSVETLHVPLWVALAGKVGVQRSASTVAIPAFLFGAMQLERPLLHRRQVLPPDPAREAADAAHAASWHQWFTARDCVATPDPATGAMRLRLADATARLRCELPAGRWRVRTDPPDAAVRLGLDAAAAGAPAELTVPSAGVHTLHLHRTGEGAGADAPVHVARVVLERLP